MIDPDLSLVAFDTETSGKYPLGDELCEIAGVKWQNGQIVAEFQSLIKISRPMPEEVIKIHGITDEMLINASSLRDVLSEFSLFIAGSLCIAHHAPFDLGFLMAAFERENLTPPSGEVLCSSLTARRQVKGVLNHKLQTLAKHFMIDSGQAHRALDDARTCLRVVLKILELKKGSLSFDREIILGLQGAPLKWSAFSIRQLTQQAHMRVLVDSISSKRDVDLSYSGGSRPGQYRRVRPIGMVRSPQGDYLVAYDGLSPQTKRYLIEKIVDAKAL